MGFRVDITAAVIRTNGGPFTLEDVVLDEPRPDEILVRVVGVGVCHSDIVFAQRGSTARVLGHEGVGFVERLGSDVSGFAVGDRVLMSFHSCGGCRACLRGLPAYCAQFMDHNVSGQRPDGSMSIRDRDGAPVAGNFFGQSSFATYALAHARNVVAVPSGVSDEAFPLLGPLGCGIQTGAGAVLNALCIPPGSSFVVTGAGGVGLSAVLAAVLCGAADIIAVDLHDDRLHLATDLGATRTINGRDYPDLASAVREIIGDGAAFGLDTTGNGAVIRSLVRAVRPSGTVGLVGIATPGSQLDLDERMQFEGRTVRAIMEGDALPQVFIPRLIDLHLRGEFAFDKMIRTYPFAEIQQAVRDSESGVSVKPVLLL